MNRDRGFPPTKDNFLFVRGRMAFAAISDRLLSGCRIPARRILCLLFVVTVLALAAGCGGGGLLVVNDPGDSGDDNPGDGFCRTALVAPKCTLRAALEEANALAGPNAIYFSLPDASISIRPQTALPVISDELTVDGTTQPGYVLDPIVFIDGSDLDTPPTEVLVTAAGSVVTLRGLQILHSYRSGIYSRGNIVLEHMAVSYHGRYGFFSSGGAVTVTASISDTVFSENDGKGIGATNTDLTILDTDITENHDGGITVADGTLRVESSALEDNYSLTTGGGITIAGSTLAELEDVDILDNGATDVGGGIYLQDLGGAELTLLGTTITGNSGSMGGGLYLEGGDVTMDSHTVVNDNRANSGGGGIYLEGSTLDITGSTIGEAGHGNNPDEDGDGIGVGGGIYNNGGDLSLLASGVKDNFGSGIYSRGGSVLLAVSDINNNFLHGVEMVTGPLPMTFEAHQSLFNHNVLNGFFGSGVDALIVDSSFRGNSSQGIRMDGGRLSLWRSTVAENGGSGVQLELVDEADIKQTAIYGNSTTGSGAGLLIAGASGAAYLLENVTVHDNHAEASGGGLELAGGTATLNNVTLTGNSALDGGGIHSTSPAIIMNSIVSYNTGGNCSGVITSSGHNIDNSTTCPLFSPGDQTNTAVSLGPLQDNGGPTFTRAVFAPGAAFDAGDDATCADIDQRDVPRPQAMHCDVGAYEIEAMGKSASTQATPTPTIELPQIFFDPVEFSSETLFKGQGCEPLTLIIRVRVTPSEGVDSAGLFYRLTAKEGGQSLPWSEGLALSPQGDGWYGLTLIGDDLPNIHEWQSEAWLDFQFVANGPDGKVIARSEVIRKVVYAMCKRYNNY